ncbi:MAG TPA: hypothetical protein VLZ83_12190 [Edaphocola sp.]|nr:hypothetical protein [Edaphocola sp.]
MEELQTNQGFWDNFLWPLAVAAIIGIAIYFRKKISKMLQKKELITIINLKMNEFYEISFGSDEKLFSKLLLIKSLVRDGKNERFEIKIKKLFLVKRLDSYEKEHIELHIKSKEQEFKDKIEILLKHPYDNRMESDANVIYVILENIIRKRDPNGTNCTKIEMFREQEPKITFPVYLSQSQFSDLAKKQNKTEQLMKASLQFEFNNLSIFNDVQLYEEVVPAFVNEIYRIKTRKGFDIDKKNWSELSLYEIGLG